MFITRLFPCVHHIASTSTPEGDQKVQHQVSFMVNEWIANTLHMAWGQSLVATRDSSVGRAGDCSMINLEIPRSAVRLRLARTVHLLKHPATLECEGNIHSAPKVTRVDLKSQD